MNGDVNTDPLILPATLDLAAAENFLELIRHRVNGEAPLHIDASEVDTITLPCVQIILAALRSREAISIKSPSAEFINAFEDLGVAWMQYLEIAIDPEPVQEQGSEPIATETEPQATDTNGEQDPSSCVDSNLMSENVMGKRILTIDDSKTMRDMLMLTLAEAGFDVLQAVDGQDGLDVLVNEQVDVVITDINMPRMDGYEVIRQLRKNPAHKATPILVLTTESETEKRNIARQAGATGWMVKPFDPDRLVETVRKVAP